MWLIPVIAELEKLSGAESICYDACMHGGTRPKAQRLLSSLASLKEMAVTCDKSHVHQPLISGRCANAAFYPIKLIRTILQGIRATKDAEDAIRHTQQAHRDMINSISSAAGNIPTDDSDHVVHTSEVPKVEGGKMHVRYDSSNFRAK